MAWKILILTAGRTGGHRSASNALKDALLNENRELQVVDYDSNRLFLGYKGEGGEQGYVTMTTRLRLFWKVFFETTSFFAPISNAVLSKAIQRNFLRLLQEEKPDAVVSLHPCFVGSARKLLRKMSDVPFYVGLLDPMRHSRLWRDKKADLTLLPTEEALEAFRKAGFPEERLVLTGFPLGKTLFPGRREKEGKRRKLLFVNPSQKGLAATAKLIECAFPYDVDIDVITGSDGNLRRYLENHLPKREGLRIFGYVNDMKERLQEADLLLTKAGPNIMFEGIAARVPIVFTGHLPGQEERNAEYATKRGYAFKAERPRELMAVLDQLLLKNPKKLKGMREKEALCPDLDGARRMAKAILEHLSRRKGT